MTTTPTNVAVVQFNTSGITLVPYGSPEFSSLLRTLVPAAITVANQPLLPYSVFIKNDSPKAIIAYTISWASIDKAGKPYIDYRSVCDFISLNRVLFPGKQGLATIVGPLLSEAATKDQHILADIATQSQSFQDQASVIISLEAVMFEDGTSVGRDTSQAIPQIEARLRAEHDLYSDVVGKTGVGDAADAMSWLRTLAAVVPPGSHLNFTADPFLTWYQFYLGYAHGQRPERWSRSADVVRG